MGALLIDMLNEPLRIRMAAGGPELIAHARPAGRRLARRRLHALAVDGAVARTTRRMNENESKSSFYNFHNYRYE